MEKIFLLKGLDCAHCAALIEKVVGDMSCVKSARVNLMKQTLTLELNEDEPALKELVEMLVHSYEPHVEVLEYVPEQPKQPAATPANDHGDQQMLRRLVFGAIFFVSGILMGRLPILSLLLLSAGYLVLGWDVVYHGVRNLVKGRVFDENFLMAVASLGAFAIGEYHEAVAVMLFYQIGEYFQSLSVRRSRRSIAALLDIRPDRAAVLRNGVALTVHPEAVAVGEWILVRPGERIPLDGVVVEGSSNLDTSALTGESMPRYVQAGDEALSGCINQTGALTIRVTKTAGESTASKIISLVENAASRKSKTENFITAFARWYTPVVVTVAALLAVVPPLLLGGWAQWIRRGLVFLVVSCPCALVISVPLTFFGGIGAASRHGILIKGSNYLEALEQVSTLVFDKTGTLTQGQFQVAEVLPGESFTGEQTLQYAATAESLSNHPIARSIRDAWAKEIDTPQDYREIPGQGVTVSASGKQLLAGSDALMLANNIAFQPCTLPGTKIYVAADGTYVGCIRIADEIKADSRDAIAALKTLGITKTVILTGDEEAVARSVAADLGISQYYARLLPQDKVEKLEQLDREKPAGTKLAFVGDGINDAPVLARADVGIAMGAMGADAAIEAADIVLMSDQPTQLAEAIRIARTTKAIARQNIALALGLKGAILVLGALGIAGMWAAVFADVGVAFLAVLNAMRMLKK